MSLSRLCCIGRGGVLRNDILRNRYYKRENISDKKEGEEAGELTYKLCFICINAIYSSHMDITVEQ
eukprot:9704546-Ditylum_brightwellii.AAC.1